MIIAELLERSHYTQVSSAIITFIKFRNIGLRL